MIKIDEIHIDHALNYNVHLAVVSLLKIMSSSILNRFAFIRWLGVFVICVSVSSAMEQPNKRKLQEQEEYDKYQKQQEQKFLEFQKQQKEGNKRDLQKQEEYGKYQKQQEQEFLNFQQKQKEDRVKFQQEVALKFKEDEIKQEIYQKRKELAPILDEMERRWQEKLDVQEAKWQKKFGEQTKVIEGLKDRSSCSLI